MINVDSYVVTDIHGCFNTFMNLLNLMEIKDEDFLINLGDSVDRGPKIKEVLDYLINRKNIINIIGNHDYHFIDYAKNGKTANNYFMLPQGLQETIDQLGSDIQKYADFIRTWKTYVKTEDYVFCHSTYPWQKEDKGLFAESHFWDRWFYESHDDYLNYDGPVIVHGHTPVNINGIYEKINDKLIGICLDGGACYKTPTNFISNPCLRGMRLSDGKIFEVPYSD